MAEEQWQKVHESFVKNGELISWDKVVWFQVIVHLIAWEERVYLLTLDKGKNEGSLLKYTVECRRKMNNTHG